MQDAVPGQAEPSGVFLLKAAARPRKTSLRRRFAKWVNSVVDWLVRAWVLKSSAPGARELVVTSACPGLCIGLLPPSEKRGLRHAFAPFRRCLIFSPRFHARPGNVRCTATLGTLSKCALRRKTRGRCRIRFPPRNLLKIYLVPFCVGYSRSAWNQMLLSRVCFSIYLGRLLFDLLGAFAFRSTCGLRL